MKARAIVVCIIVLLAVLWLPAPGRAQSTDCNSPTMLVADGRVSPPGTTWSIGSGITQWFALVGTANHSYEVTLSNVSAGTGSANIAVFRLTDVTLAGCVAGASSVTVRIDAGNDPGIVTLSLNLPSPGRRAVFTVPATDDYFVRVTNSTGGALAFTMVASDTTLFNPLWSTFGGFETFYKLYNTTNNSCSVTLSLRSDADAAVASSTFTVNAGRTTATRNTGPTDLNVADDQAGHALITSNCPAGAIQVDGFLGFFGATTSVLPIKILAARESAH